MLMNGGVAVVGKVQDREEEEGIKTERDVEKLAESKNTDSHTCIHTYIHLRGPTRV